MFSIRKASALVLAAVVAATALGAVPSANAEPDTRATAEPVARHERTILATRLHGSELFPRAHGVARFVSNGEGFHLVINVDNVPRLAGERVDFYVGGRHVGSASVDRRGSAAIRVHAESDYIPNGERVTVETQRGHLVAGGIFP